MATILLTATLESEEAESACSQKRRALGGFSSIGHCHLAKQDIGFRAVRARLMRTPRFGVQLARTLGEWNVNNSIFMSNHCDFRSLTPLSI